MKQKKLKQDMKLLRVTYENPDMKLTDFVRSTTLDHVSVFECDSLNEFNSAKTTAYNVKQEKREDGYKYKVSLDNTRMKVSVTLVK